MANGDAGCMPAGHAQILRRCRVALLRDLDPEDVVDLLYQEKVITEDHVDDLRAASPRKKRAVALLDLLPRRGANALPMFIKALQEPYEHLAAMVQAHICQIKEDVYDYYMDADQVLRSSKLATEATESTEELYDETEVKEIDEDGYIQMPGIARVDKKEIVRSSEQTESLEPSATAVVIAACEAEEIKCPEFNMDVYQTSGHVDESEEYEDFESVRVPVRSLPMPPLPGAKSYENVNFGSADELDAVPSDDNDPTYTKVPRRLPMPPPPKQEEVRQDSVPVTNIEAWDPFLMLFYLLYAFCAYLKSLVTRQTAHKNDSLTEKRSVPLAPIVVPATKSEGFDIVPDGLHARPPPAVPESDPGVDEVSNKPSVKVLVMKYGLELTGETYQLAAGDLVFLDPTMKPSDPAFTAVTDALSRRLVVARCNLRLHGDPRGKPWFFPVAISSKQATMILSRVDLPGCFLVYRPTSNIPDVLYNLSICLHSGSVSTHYVYRDTNLELSLKGQRKFFTIIDLINYYKCNRGILACRLRRSPAAISQPEALLGNVDLRYHLDASNIVHDPEADHSTVGRGYFGEVVRGCYNGEKVAIKVLRQINDPWALDDFVEEARIGSRLVHPNILRFLGITPDLKEPRLLSEYMTDGDLRRCLKDQMFEDCDTKVLLDLCRHVMEALKYLRSMKYILHRDIAARNCLVTGVLGMAQLKLCDFGLARQVTEDEYIAEMNEKVAVRWSAPEVLQALRFSTASDIWAAAVLFWEIFSGGELPFEGLNNTQVTQVTIARDILPQPKACPDDVYVLLKKCWRWQAKKRPTAESLLEMMQQQSYFYPPIRTAESEASINTSQPESTSADEPPALPERNLDGEGNISKSATTLSRSASTHYKRFAKVFKKKNKNKAPKLWSYVFIFFLYKWHDA